MTLPWIGSPPKHYTTSLPQRSGFLGNPTQGTSSLLTKDNLASRVYDSGTQAAVGVGQEASVVQALVELTYSTHEGVR